MDYASRAVRYGAGAIPGLGGALNRRAKGDDRVLSLAELSGDEDSGQPRIEPLKIGKAGQRGGAEEEFRPGFRWT